MDILVFKTNLSDKKQVRKLFRLLKTIEGILKWNVDMEDTDKILRVEALNISAARNIEETLLKGGYYCKELD